eukprot:302503-Lingulodinium_polyedra.AAC.1
MAECFAGSVHVGVPRLRGVVVAVSGDCDRRAVPIPGCWRGLSRRVEFAHNKPCLFHAKVNVSR